MPFRKDHVENAYRKDIFRNIRNGKKRFLAIAVITLLGVMMFSGLQASCMDLRRSADRFFDRQNLHDLSVQSTLGLTDGDVSALQKVDGVEKAEGIYSEEGSADIGSGRLSVQLQTLTDSGIDQPYLVEGRLPEKADEAAVTQKFAEDSKLSVGDVFSVLSSDAGDTADVQEAQKAESTADAKETGQSGKSENTAEEESAGKIEKSTEKKESRESTNRTDSAGRLENQEKHLTGEFRIVGIVVDPTDVDNPFSAVSYRTDSSAADKAYVLKDAAAADYYTAVLLTLSGVKQLPCYSEEYEDLVSSISDIIRDQIEEDREDFRTAEVKRDAQASLAGMILQSAQGFSEDWVKSHASESGAGSQIADAQKQIEDIEDAQWYIQDRTSLSGYTDIRSDADSIESIGTVFPIVFFLVAILISLTTAARMVDEDRSLIGTYKSLGYTDREIRAKYLVYSLLACAFGSAGGTAMAFAGLPAFLFSVFRVMYLLPSYSMSFLPAYGILGPALFTAGVLLSAYAACRRELKETPASLMRPKAPRAGSRVLLERFSPLWRRMPFLSKVTARNLFRYKGRLFMTIFGIGGCMALLLFGFSIRDSVSDLEPRQYEQTTKYDVLAVSTKDGNDRLLSYIRSSLQPDSETEETEREKEDAEEQGSAVVQDYINVQFSSVKLKLSDGGEIAAQLVIIPDTADLSSYVSLKAVHPDLKAERSEEGGSDAGSLADNSARKAKTDDAGRQKGESEPGREDKTDGENAAGSGELGLKEGDVYVTQNAGEVLGFTDGGFVQILLPDLDESRILVTGLVKNYLGNYVYMTQSTFERYYGSGSFAPNAALIHLTDACPDQASWAEELSGKEGMVSCVSVQKLRDQFGSSFSLINMVVLIVILMSAALAFVVLFTLSVTNVSERVRELATIKVLGFYDHEVHAYVNRETMILTIIGILIGIPLGRAFAQTLTVILKLPSIYLAVSLHGVSYAAAAVLTLLFAWIVRLMTNRSLNRIDPASALKSVE